MKPEYIFRLYRAVKEAGTAPLLIEAVEKDDPRLRTRYELEKACALDRATVSAKPQGRLKM